LVMRAAIQTIARNLLASHPRITPINGRDGFS
jgi:hypothetical protein